MATSEEDLRAARELTALALNGVGWASRDRFRGALIRATRGRLGRRHDWPAITILGTPWQDNPSARGMSWRERAAYVDGLPVFGVDYQVCRRCRAGWVEEPHTDERYRRCGLAAAGLAALRAEHPGLAWHTAGNHMPDSEPFWQAVSEGVPGGYQQREICGHRVPPVSGRLPKIPGLTVPAPSPGRRGWKRRVTW